MFIGVHKSPDQILKIRIMRRKLADPVRSAQLYPQPPAAHELHHSPKSRLPRGVIFILRGKHTAPLKQCKVIRDEVEPELRETGLDKRPQLVPELGARRRHGNAPGQGGGGEARGVDREAALLRLDILHGAVVVQVDADPPDAGVAHFLQGVVRDGVRVDYPYAAGQGGAEAGDEGFHGGAVIAVGEAVREDGIGQA